MTTYTNYPHLTSKTCIVLWTGLCSGQGKCCKYVCILLLSYMP